MAAGSMILCAFTLLILVSSIQSRELSVGRIDFPLDDPAASPRFLVRRQLITASDISVEDINNSNFLGDLKLKLNSSYVATTPSLSIEATINFSESNYTFIVGNPSSFSSEQTAVVATVFGMAQISYITLSPVATRFKDFYRLVPPGTSQISAVKETILYYSQFQQGWTDVAIISTTDGFGISYATEFIDLSMPELTVLSYRQYIAEGSEENERRADIRSELEEMKKSGARVLISYIFDNWSTFTTIASEVGLIGEQYVWFVPSNIVGTSITPEARNFSRGVIGYAQEIPVSPEFTAFKERWAQLDPEEYPGAGPDYPPSVFVSTSYDMITATALAIRILDEQGLVEVPRIPAEKWVDALSQTDFVGLSGRVRFDSNGDLIATLSVLYYDPDTNTWNPSATWTQDNGYMHHTDVIWFSNTTDIPDLDVREPFRYYSCHEKEFGYDETGKEVSRHTPDGSNIDDIDSDYYCDHFIDCQNISDESFDCGSNFVLVFIIFGIVTGVLIFIAILLIVYVIVFGIVLNYQRLRAISPFFLLLILVSVIFGYSSVFAWFGKPNSVACGFQPWLLGLPGISMIAALSVKTFRLWRIFRFPLKKTRISNFELFLVWFVVMIPPVIILVLWTIISTPTAKMEEHDGKDHFVCTTGGFTGEPGGLVFFCVFAGYGALVLLCGSTLTYLGRHVPSAFNETQLLAISIYNLGFLSVVIIPVYLVVISFNPFIAWLIRTCAVLYAFTATMVLQFLPSVVCILIIDKCQNNSKVKVSSASSATPGSKNK